MPARRPRAVPGAGRRGPEPHAHFDAELAPDLLGRLFDDVEVESWDAPLLELPGRAAVRDYLIGKGTEPDHAQAAADGVELPLKVTKRGALVFGRKRSGCAGVRAPAP